MRIVFPGKYFFRSVLPVMISLIFLSCINDDNSGGGTIPYLGLLPNSTKGDPVISHTAFTLCYSEADEQPRWVAYELTKEMCTSNAVKRKDKFIPDPLVKTGSAETSDYKNSGYDRGHLCPAGDMNWSQQSMEESFYMSNMSPQVHAFNAGIWEKLENRVRHWAELKGKVFVVAGGILGPGLEKIGVKNKITVPHYFFKIVYSEKGNGSAVAFVMPNLGITGKSYLDFTLSIDSVESLTGIDFFPQLPDSTENRIEKNKNFAGWVND